MVTIIATPSRLYVFVATTYIFLRADGSEQASGDLQKLCNKTFSMLLPDAFAYPTPKNCALCQQLGSARAHSLLIVSRLTCLVRLLTIKRRWALCAKPDLMPESLRESGVKFGFAHSCRRVLYSICRSSSHCCTFAIVFGTHHRCYVHYLGLLYFGVWFIWARNRPIPNKSKLNRK